MTREVFVDLYLAFEISGNSNVSRVRKRKEQKNCIPSYV